MPAIQSLNQAELQQVIGLLWASVSPSIERVTKAGEMAQRLQSLIPKVPDSIPGTHTEGLTAIHNSSSRGSDIVFWELHAYGLQTYIQVKNSHT